MKIKLIQKCMPGSPTWSLSLRFPHQNLVYTSPLTHMVTFPAHLILPNFITQIILGEEYRSFSSSVGSFIHYPFISSLLRPNILLSTLFYNTLSLRSSLNVSYQVSHPYKTTGRIIVPYILIFKFFCHM
jgi:hypothetical protein